MTFVSFQAILDAMPRTDYTPPPIRSQGIDDTWHRIKYEGREFRIFTPGYLDDFENSQTLDDMTNDEAKLYNGFYLICELLRI